MTLSADYIDRLACPTCGTPVRRIGRWYVHEGEWRFEATPISARRPRRERPEYDGQRWDNFPRTKVEADRRGAEVAKRVDEWHYMVDFECMGSLYSDTPAAYECGVMQRQDCVPYRGPELEWMQAPTRPERKAVTLPDPFDRKTESAGSR